MHILLLCLLVSTGNAQLLSGIWRGKLTQSPGGCFPVYFIEVQVKDDFGKVAGATYHFSDVTNFVKEKFEGDYDEKSKLLCISETEILSFHIPSDCVPCIKNYTLQYIRNEKGQMLSGDWGGRIINSQTACPSGKITLTKVPTSIFNEIKVDTGQISINFYDNAEVDGDTISVIVDNVPVVTRQKLGVKPITVILNINLNMKEHEVVMVAENEGSIPPNTALLTITTGEKHYRLFLSPDSEQRKILLRFVYKKPSA